MEGGRQRSPEDDDAPYLPERYRQHVVAKKQRRLLRKILIVSGIVVLAVILTLIILGDQAAVHQQSRQTAPPKPGSMIITADTPQPGTISQAPPGSRTENATIQVTPQIILESGLQNQTGSGLLPVDTATDLVSLEYPALYYTVTSINLTEKGGLQYYEFGIIPRSEQDTGGTIQVWIDAVRGEPFSPGQDKVRVTAEQAKRIVTTSFRSQKPDQVRVRYRDIPTTPGSWDFFLVKMNTTFLSGSLDPDTGQIISFSSRPPAGGQPAAPVISLADAQKIADKTIAGLNGPISINMSAGTYQPQKGNETAVSGHYVFEYERIVQDIPCEGDGLTITIDPVTGDVTGYERRWNNPDNAFSVASEPLVTKREATFAILQKVTEISPGSIDSVRIISTRLQWKDRHAPGVTPRPGSIPLAWNVAFDDETLRAATPPMTATGWVDAHTGAILGMDYSRGQ